MKIIRFFTFCTGYFVCGHWPIILFGTFCLKSVKRKHLNFIIFISNDEILNKSYQFAYWLWICLLSIFDCFCEALKTSISVIKYRLISSFEHNNQKILLFIYLVVYFFLLWWIFCIVKVCECPIYLHFSCPTYKFIQQYTL